jgi:glycosyltransferase involved in cell wall biosynthesis
MHIPATDRKLTLLYRRAAAFVFPSLYEGFGMPILEAFACRCPVVLCDTPAMREIAADAGLFFRPNSSSDLAAAVSRILKDQALREDLVERGSQRATRFSWQKTAAETAAVYHRALNSASRS